MSTMLDQVLSEALLEEILNRLENARFIAIVSCVCKSLKEAGRRVRSARLICLNEYHVTAREGRDLHDTKGASSSASTAAVPSASSTDEEGFSSGDESSMVVFRDVVVDYGQQAIMCGSGIVKILSQNCKVLKTLDLWNMFIDSSELEDMPKLTNFMLRLVKVIGDALNHINARMRNLSTLALPGVFGVTHAHLDFLATKVLCLVLLTIAKDMQVSDPFSSKQHVVLSPSALVEVLSQALLEEIFNRLENASFIARASCVCKSFKEAGRRVRSARLICLNEYHVKAREGGELHDTKGASSSTSTAAVPSACSNDEGSSSGDESNVVVFREVVVDFLKNKSYLLQLRIEIESTLQSKSVPVPERRRTDFWLSDPFHLRRWVPSVQATLLHLCIVDYGQQAIMRRTNILKILSQNCKVLQTLDLRNMFMDSSELEDMPKLTNFTLRCVKVIGDALNHINARMRNLSTLALLGVFGVTHAHLDFPAMKVLCLGLSTIAKDVSVELPSLVKLQLKIMCPEKLTVAARSLKYMAFNLEVRDTCKVELRNLHNLEEVLYGASSFATFWSLVSSNANLNKLFLDIPCMALGEDGNWLGVLKGIPLNLPIFTNLLLCERLGVVNIGPGLWHVMEENLEQLSAAKSWPPFHRLILHMIPQSLDACLAVLEILLKPTLLFLEVHVHANSPVSYETIVPEVRKVVSCCGWGIVFKPFRWTKSLNFSCFRF